MAMGHRDICHALLGCPLEDVLVFDTETTGVNSGDDEILSIAITDGYGKVLYESYVRPTRHRSWPEAERVNHISPAMVSNAPTINQCTGIIRSYFCSSSLVVGYNVDFDITFLVNSGVIEWSELRATFDVMREFSRVHGSQRYGSGRYRYSKLAWCAKYYGYTFPAHDALEDTKATAYCFRSLLYDSVYNGLLISDLSSVMSALSTTQTKASEANSRAILGSFSKASVGGELVLGEITRGKNKGCRRLECSVGDKCVGILSKASESKVLSYYGASGVDDLQTPIPVETTISTQGDRCRCTVAVGMSELKSEVSGFTALYQSRVALVKCLSKMIKPGAGAVVGDEFASRLSNAPTVIGASSKESKGSGCSVLIVALVVVIGLLIARTLI